MPGAAPTFPHRASPSRCDPVRGRAPNRGPTAGVRGPRVPSARGPSTPTPPPRPEGSLRRLPRDAASPGGPAQRRGCDRAAGATSSRFHPFLTPLQAGGAGRAAPHRAPHRGHLPEASSSSEGAAAAASSSLLPSLPWHLPAAPCGRSASVRGRGRDGAGSAAAGAQLPRPRAAGAAPGRAARQPRLPRAAATARGTPRVAPRGSVPLAGCVVRGWGVLGES